MQCAKCLYTSETGFRFCPECGTPVQPGEDPAATGQPAHDGGQTAPGRDPVEQARLQSERIAYVRRDYDPCRDGRYPQIAPALPCNTTVSPDTGQAMASPGPAYAGGQTAAQRPSTTGTIVLAIVNMLCCGFGISMILGLIALIFAIIASGEPVAAEAEQKIRWARTMNFIGLAFIVLQLLVFLFLAIASVIFSQGGSPFMPGNFPRDFPLG